MTLETIRDILAWCSVINIILLLVWFIMFALAHDCVYRMHSKWYKLSQDAFNTVHYSGIAFFKIVIFVFNIVPYLALHIVA
jgi:hypothetical protein